MKVLVFGLANEEAILARLRKRFPHIGLKKFRKSDDFTREGRDMVVFDAVKGISRVMLIDNLKSSRFENAVEAHDLVVTLRVLLRIGALDSAKLIAVPEGYPAEAAVEEIGAILSLFGRSSELKIDY